MSEHPPSQTLDLRADAGNFFSLTPDAVLHAVEQSGFLATGSCYALNSLENRVYDVELEEDGRRVIAKFYRPGRWEKATILDEHALLTALDAHEIPTCPPLPFPDGGTLRQTPDGIYFALFPRVGGRAPEELDGETYARLGRLLARIHNVAADLKPQHRPVISPDTYGQECLNIILGQAQMSPGVASRYEQTVKEIIAIGREWFAGVELTPVHGDCHRGNLLNGRDGWFFLDFDDMGRAPAVQDLWLLLPGRRDASAAEIDAMLSGYEQFRDFDHGSLRLIEVLRALRYVRYAAWVQLRFGDPAFPRAFPQFGTEAYWEQQLSDLYEQLHILQTPQVQPTVWM